MNSPTDESDACEKDRMKPTSMNIAAVPMYERICEDLRGRVSRGDWKPGEKLPGRTRLATEYGVDLSTLQRAITALLTDGLLIADSRRGTFVPMDIEMQAEPATAPAEKQAQQAQGQGMVGVVARVYPAPIGRPSSGRFWLPAIQSIETKLSFHGYTVQLFNLVEAGGMRTIADMTQAALDQGAAGVVLVGVEEDDPALPEVVDMLQETGTPAVLVSDTELEYEIEQVFFDHKRLGFLAAKQFLLAGHNSIVFVATHAVNWIDSRADGARNAFRQFGLGEENLVVIPRNLPTGSSHDPDFEQAGYDAARDLLAGKTRFTAVIAANDLVAYGFIRAAKERGLQSGIDYSIIGFDDDDLSRLVSLSTFHPPLTGMGEEASRILSAALQGGEPRVHIELWPSFIARGSTAPQPGRTPRVLRHHHPAGKRHTATEAATAHR